MKRSLAAERYSRALFELAKADGKEREVLEELRIMAKALSQQGLQEELASPVIDRADLITLLENFLSKSKASELVKNTVLLLAKKGRIGLFSQMEGYFEAEMDRDAGVVRGTVSSAALLPKEERTKIEGFVSRITKQKAILDFKEEPELIGGLIAKVGSFTFDDSVGSQLARLEGHMKRSNH